MGCTPHPAVISIPQTQAHTWGTKHVKSTTQVGTHHTHIHTTDTHTPHKLPVLGEHSFPSFSIGHSAPCRASAPFHTLPHTTHTTHNLPNLHPPAPQDPTPVHTRCPAMHTHVLKALPQRGPRDALKTADEFLWLVHRKKE